MDNLTHSLVGALLGQAGLKRRTGLAMPALIIGANVPDIDATCVLLGNMQHLALRRGITHGPIAWVVLPLVVAGGLYGFDRWQERRGQKRFGRPEARLPVHFGWLFALAFIACLTHPALDWLNSYGVRLLEPFSHRWFYGDTLFIVDVWLWLGMGFATWLSLRREKRGGEWRRPAQVAIVAVVAYIGANWALTSVAEEDLKIYGNVAGFETSKLVTISSPRLFGGSDGVFGVRNHWVKAGPQGLDGVATIPITDHPCAWPDTETLRKTRPDLDAFLFWSRAPFAERAPDGSVIIRDARFADPLTSSRFTVALPETRCEELPVR